MRHKLILFCGSSPGVGKSTLSRLLFRQMTFHGLPARWLHEQDMVEAFERFVPGINEGDLTPERLLHASAELVQWCQSEKTTFITDSYLPGFYYLYGRYPDLQIVAYSADLYRTLSSLQPLVIYVRSDVETALQRGVRQRGEQWLQNITRYLNGWKLPLYGATPKPLRTVADVIEFFTRVDRLAMPLLAQWPDLMVLDSGTTPIKQLVTTMLNRLQVVEIPSEDFMEEVELQRYIGTYIAAEGDDVGAQLEVSSIGDVLVVNTYWPGGTRLLPEGNHQFHLDGTNHRMSFELQADGLPYGLIYDSGHGVQRYRKRS